MKKFTFILLALLSFAIYGQDVTYNFNAGAEGFTAPGGSGFTNFAATDGNITTGDVSVVSTGFPQLRGPNGLGLTHANYRVIRVVVENSTDNTDWQILNFETGSTSGGDAEKTNVTIPVVAAGSGFTTFDFEFPASPVANAGLIDRIGIRAQQNNSYDWSSDTGEFKIAQIVIINSTLEDSFVTNPDFETATDWTASGGEATGAFTTTDPQEGLQSGQLTFTTDQTSTQTFDNTIFDFGTTVNPVEINATYWVKATSTAIEVQLLYDLYEADGTTRISGNNTGVYNVTAINTWEQVTVSKVITDEFNQIQFRLKVKEGALNGDVVSFDDVQANFSFFQTSNSWTGSADTDWTNTANWTNGIVPVANKNADIQFSTNNPIISSSTGATVNNLVVDASADLSIAAGGSLIVNGTSTGNVTYNRNLTFVSGNANGWHLISSPVAGQTYNDTYATANSLATNSGRRGLAYYNDANASGSKYTYLLSDDTNAGSFNTGVYSGSGVGYSAKRASTGNIAFTGTINTDNVNGVSVSTTGNGFNLLGVPYTSYISSQTFLNDNSNLDQSQIWVWKQDNTSGGNFIAMTAKADNFVLAPGQGFFVKANSGTTVNFAETNQTANADTFQKTARTEIQLLVNNGQTNRFAKIYYLNNVTKGYDLGWEGETFSGIKSNFDVFSQLLEENQGKNYQVQSLPNTDLESMVVPIGITANAGEITFSTNISNLPSGLKVFIEDRESNTFTRIDEANSTYKITLTEKTDGIGRFYLHTKSSALSTDNVNLENISVYMINQNALRVTGLSQGKSTIKLYNTLGKQVVNTTFTSNGVYELNLPKLATGLYIVQLENENGKLNKKIILE